MNNWFKYGCCLPFAEIWFVGTSCCVIYSINSVMCSYCPIDHHVPQLLSSSVIFLEIVSAQSTFDPSMVIFSTCSTTGVSCNEAPLYPVIALRTRTTPITSIYSISRSNERNFCYLMVQEPRYLQDFPYVQVFLMLLEHLSRSGISDTPYVLSCVGGV